MGVKHDDDLVSSYLYDGIITDNDNVDKYAVYYLNEAMVFTSFFGNRTEESVSCGRPFQNMTNEEQDEYVNAKTFSNEIKMNKPGASHDVMKDSLIKALLLKDQELKEYKRKDSTKKHTP